MSFIFLACLLLLASLLLPEWLLLLGAYLGWRAAAAGIYTCAEGYDGSFNFDELN
jgi:hypothetical protein